VEEIGIGEFARRSRLSLKALRLYDERGVLVPSRVDQASGYRYYDVGQVDEARLVVMLRQLPLPLAAIRELLACDPADAAARIAEHAVHFQPAVESLEAWKQEQGIEDERLTLKPEDLGLRTTYLATGPVTATSVPDDYCDFAVPFA
jgi:DNA-binding transcriptional MerR regulator